MPDPSHFRPGYGWQMTDSASNGPTPGKDYRSLPPSVALEDTIVSKEANPLPDPHADRNVDQHLALRDD